MLFGGITVAITEVLSPLHMLRRGPLAVVWSALALAGAVWIWRRGPRLPRIRLRPLEGAIAAVIAVIAALAGTAAAMSPPNSADAMAYHMPRVVYWAQAGSVAFFPTSYFNQISLQPVAEYFMLHSYVLSGGDHFVNLVAFGAFLACIAGVSAVAGALGLSAKGQAFAALFCATLPSAILQASGAKNDSLLALWLVCLVYFLARRNLAFAALAFGLALGTKATAYLFAPPMVVALLVYQQAALRNWLRTAGLLTCGMLLVNAPQYWRNVELSGRPLGYDSAQGDGVYRWRNERLGWRALVSNGLRNTSEQFGARSARWNQAVYDSVLRVHAWLGIDPQDAATTWRGEAYRPPRNSNHEADANSRWHLLLFMASGIFAACTRRRAWWLYAGGVVCGFLLFSFYLKWQPFEVRLELPLLVLAAPVTAALLDAIPLALAVAVGLFLVGGARLPLLENWTRPLRGPRSVFALSRDERYFADMSQWGNQASYVTAVDLVARSGCLRVGIDNSQNQVEYPFQALLREREPEVRFVHVGVETASKKYGAAEKVCAVFCPDCAGVEEKAERYSGVGERVTVGKFWVFE
jgi:hypothetical protein